MDKKKSILLIIAGIVSLLIITIIFILLLKQPANNENYIFSKQETINVSTKTEDISFFNNIDYTKLSFTDDNLIKEFKNIVSVTDDNVSMKNVFLYEATGDFNINYKDNKFSNSEFTTLKLKTSADAFSSLNKINSKISDIAGVDTKKINLISNEGTTELENEIQLNQKNSKVSVDYIINSLTLTINMDCGNNEYIIHILLQ